MDGWMDGWWLKKILGWRSTWGRVGGRSNFFRSLRPSLSKGSWTCWTWSICPGKSVEHVTSTEGKHTLSKYWGSNSTSPWLSWKWIQFVFIAIINQRIYFLFIREFILPHSMFGVGLHESLRWRLVGIFQQPCLWYWYQTPGQGNYFRERKLLHLRSSVIPTWKEMRLADPGSTRVPLCPTRGRSRLPERATIRPSAFL